MNTEPDDAGGPSDPETMPVKTFDCPTGQAWIEVSVFGKKGDFTVAWQRTVLSEGQLRKEQRIPAAELNDLRSLLLLAQKWLIFEDA